MRSPRLSNDARRTVCNGAREIAAGRNRQLNRRIARATRFQQCSQARLTYQDDLEQGVSSADLGIEAIPERLDLKRALFAQLDALAASNTILPNSS